MIAAIIARFRAGAYVRSSVHNRLLADESIFAKTFGQALHAVEDRRAGDVPACDVTAGP
jgi:hypothetical protein